MFSFKKKAKVEVFLRSAVFSDVSKHKKRPSYFSYEGCFQNLVQTIDPSFNLTILLNTKPDPWIGLLNFIVRAKSKFSKDITPEAERTQQIASGILKKS